MSSYVVTGSSSGIGEATVRRLAAGGHDVLAGIRDPADAALLAGVARPIVLDVTSIESLRAATREIEALVGEGGLDGIVNNAGVGVPGPLETLSLDDLRRQLDVNVIGQVAVTQAMLPMLRPARGRIVFVGSVGGVLATPFGGAYHASKFAIEAIADVWRQELEPDGIAVVLIEPAATSTPIWDKAIAQLDALQRRNPARLRRYDERLEAFRESLRSADEHGASPAKVAETIAEALSTSRPKPRYAIGASGKLATTLRPLLPDRLFDKLARRTAHP